jgi:uncharacterized membrane protein
MTITLLTSGILAGGLVLVAAALVPTFRALPATASVRLHQTIDAHINRYITPDTAFTILLGLILIVARDGRTPRLLLAAGVLLCIAVTVISVTQNVPLNRRIQEWSSDQPPPEFRAVHERWARSHLVRTIAGVLALTAFAAAAVTA